MTTDVFQGDAMRWTFKQRGKDVSLEVIEDVAAIKVVEGLPENITRSQLRGVAGSSAKFERAGWILAESKAAGDYAAKARSTLPDVRPVRRVFMNRFGDLMIETHKVIVQFVPDMSEEVVLKQMEADRLTPVHTFRFAQNTFEARLTTEEPLIDAIDRLQRKTDTYQFAEPAILQRITGRKKPDDELFGAQWHHSMICSEKAWKRTRGRRPERPVRVAVIDTGMQIDHPDLKEGIIGGGHFKSASDGRVSFIRLRAGMSDFPNGSHGTFCLGMAGARMNNNNEGGCGIAPESDLLAFALNDLVRTQATLARAIACAADPSQEDEQLALADGADVISCSLGPDNGQWDISSVLDLAINFAADKGRSNLGIPIFWAVSNRDQPIAGDEVCSHAKIIAVGRSNSDDSADGSAFGPELKFLAPGANVLSTLSGSNYGRDSGSSFAAPLAAGVGALVIASRPEWTRDEVSRKLCESCDKVPDKALYGELGRHDDYGFGRINAELAVL